MKDWNGILLIFVLQIFYLLGCASEEVRETVPAVKELSCTFNQLDGECKYFDNGATLCSTGTCSEGDCTTGKGVITYPGGSKLEGIFKDGKLNGAGSYQGCSESFVGTFKNDYKEKGIFVSKDSNKIYEGTFKDELKSGNFNVYLDYNQRTPFAENGKVLAGVYSKKIVVQYIMDIDKIDYYEEKKFQKKRESEITELKKLLKVERDVRLREEAEYRRREELENRKKEKERQEEEKRSQAREREYETEKKVKNKAEKECFESRYKYSSECTKFEKKYDYNPFKEN